jgi:predicted permease
LRTILAGLRTLFRRDAVERELDDELQHYLALSAQERIDAGMSPDAAARAARAEMGSVEATKERVRSGRWETHLESLWRDVRYALRGLRRNPAFAAIVILTLALGIGANTVMFSVVNAVLLRPLPYRDSHRLVLIYTDDVRRGLHREATAYATITDWKERSRAFSDIAFYSTGRVAPMTNNPEVRGRARSALVSGNLFELLGVSSLLGRAISAQDESTRAPVVVISYAFWQRWFAGAPDVIGRLLVIDDAAKGGAGTLTVIGVMPADFYFPDKLTDLWTPATTYWRFTRESSERFPQWARRWTAVARLAPAASLAAARADMSHIGSELSATFKSDVPDFPGFATTVMPVLDSIAGTDLQSALWILFGATALVLLVACANVANLLLARGAARHHEFALRRALGGGRGRLIRQLVIEHIVLGLAGGLAGLAVAVWAMSAVSAAAAPYVPRIGETSLDLRVLAAATIASIAAAMVFGAAPALRLSAADATDALREGGRAHGSLRLRKSRGFMVLAECALAIMLLTGAGLLLRSLNRLLSIDPGFDPRNVLTIRIEFPSEPPPSAAERTQTSTIASTRAGAREQWMTDLIARVRGIPGVEAAGFIDDLYVAGQGHQSITIPARASDQVSGELNSGWVTAGFFPVLRVPLHRGRYLTRDDAIQKIRALWSPIVTNLSLAEKERRAVPEPVVVNDAFAQRFFPGVDPIGQRFCIDPTNKTYWYEIVGVIGDMHRQGLERRTIPEYFGPYFPVPNGRTDLLVRTRTDPLAIAPIVRQEVVRSLPAVTIVEVSTADAGLAQFSGRRRLQTWLLGTFALLALALAAIGIFGLLHYIVAERTGEIGVRVALGATPRDILRLVLVQGMRSPLAGIAIGLLASAALTRVMAHLLFETRPTDPLTFLTVSSVLAVVAVAACYMAARRTLRLDPLRALRES